MLLRGSCTERKTSPGHSGTAPQPQLQAGSENSGARTQPFDHGQHEPQPPHLPWVYVSSPPNGNNETRGTFQTSKGSTSSKILGTLQVEGHLHGPRGGPLLPTFPYGTQLDQALYSFSASVSPSLDVEVICSLEVPNWDRTRRGVCLAGER